MKVFQFAAMAARHLQRGGQRVWVALLCIAFGVMALVAMNMLAQSIASAVVLQPAQQVGGDISLSRADGGPIQPSDMTQLEALRARQDLSAFTLIAHNASLVLRAAGSTDLHFVGNGMGIEPQKYPLAGSLVIGQPVQSGVAALLQSAGDVVVTRDVAEQFQLRVGDAFALSDLSVGMPVSATVRGIAFDTPNHQGDKIYYSLATAEQLAGARPAANVVIANSARATAMVAPFESSGWSVNWVAEGRDQTANVWVIGLRGAGILGLLVGGIGIADTMQVLLRRRRQEVAVWKTLGYRQGDLQAIFALEAALLGLVGSAAGAVLGVLISSGLLELFRRTSTMLYAWTFSPVPPLMGVLAGTLTTVIFAYWAIVTASQVRPMALLRNEPLDVQNMTGCGPLLLVALLTVLFLALTSVVMESALGAIIVLMGMAIGIGVLGGIFRAAVWACTRIIPTRGWPLARMAMNHLRRRGVALIFAMIALFVGVLSLSLGLGVWQISQRRMAGNAIELQGYNLNVLAAASEETAIRDALAQQQLQRVAVGYRTTLARLTAMGKPVDGMDAVLVGRDDPADYVVRGAPWDSQPDGVYASKWSGLEPGSAVQATLRDGSVFTLTVAGSYDINFRGGNLYPPMGLLISSAGFKRIAPPDSAIIFAQVEAGQLPQATSQLSAALPQATVVSLDAYAGRFMQAYQNAYALPLVMAGLAFLAGLLLMANSVSLAMLDRRYEIGILKTVGYSRRQLLTIFAVEYGLIGVLATSAGVLVIQAVLAMLALASRVAAGVLLLSLPSLLVVGLCGVGLTLVTVVTVAWQPTRVSPVMILSDRT